MNENKSKCCNKCYIPTGENCWDAECVCPCHFQDQSEEKNPYSPTTIGADAWELKKWDGKKEFEKFIKQEEPDFSKFNLGMFRQWFGEDDKGKTYKAEEIWEMLNQACPLIPKQVSDSGVKRHDEHICRFNDFPQVCECYEAGLSQAKAEQLEEILKKIEGRIKEIDEKQILGEPFRYIITELKSLITTLTPQGE